MKRRGFLKLLGLLPFVPALAEAAAKTIKKTEFIDPTPVARKMFSNMDMASGSDQTSIWFVEWQKNLGHAPTLLDVANGWKMQDHYILPVVEVLSKRNPLLQDMVWKEHAPKGWKVNWNSKIRYMPTRRGS